MARPTRFLLCAVVALHARRLPGSGPRAQAVPRSSPAFITGQSSGSRRRVVGIELSSGSGDRDVGSDRMIPRPAPRAAQPRGAIGLAAELRTAAARSRVRAAAVGDRRRPPELAPARGDGQRAAATASPGSGAVVASALRRADATARRVGVARQVSTRSIRTIRSIPYYPWLLLSVTTARASATARLRLLQPVLVRRVRWLQLLRQRRIRGLRRWRRRIVHVRDRDRIDPAACEPVERQGLRRRHAHGHRR